MSRQHNAHVVAYSAHPQDARLTVKIECLDHEWGWQTDGPGVYDRLEAMAREHNIEEAARSCATTSKGWDMSEASAKKAAACEKFLRERVGPSNDAHAFSKGWDAVQSVGVASATTCNVCYSEIAPKSASSPTVAIAEHFATAHPDIEVFQGARCSMADAVADPPTDAAECVGMSDARRLEAAIGYAPITASFPGGRGGLTHMAVIDRDRIVRDVLAAGFRFVSESTEATK